MPADDVLKRNGAELLDRIHTAIAEWRGLPEAYRDALRLDSEALADAKAKGDPAAAFFQSSRHFRAHLQRQEALREETKTLIGLVRLASRKDPPIALEIVRAARGEAPWPASELAAEELRHLTGMFDQQPTEKEWNEDLRLRLKKARAKSGKTQAEVADIFNVKAGKVLISRWERGACAPSKQNIGDVRVFIRDFLGEDADAELDD